MAVDNIARVMAASALKNQGGGGSSLPIVNTAAIGQTIKVFAVDENGQPTEWEAVDIESGGEKTWDRFSVELAEDETSYTYYCFGGDDSKAYDEFFIGIYIPNGSTVGAIRIKGFGGSPQFVQINGITPTRDLYLWIKGKIISDFGLCDAVASISYNKEGIITAVNQQINNYLVGSAGVNFLSNEVWSKPNGFQIGIGPLISGAKIYVYAR